MSDDYERSPAYKDIDQWATEHIRKWIKEVIWRAEVLDLGGDEVTEIVLMNLIYEAATIFIILEENGQRTKADLGEAINQFMTALKLKRAARRAAKGSNS